MEPQFFVHEIPSTAQLKRKFSTEKKVVLIDRKRALWKRRDEEHEREKKRDAGNKNSKRGFQSGIQSVCTKD